jgi:outer membrane protein OmpA-like peptidoglycan-associated protein
MVMATNLVDALKGLMTPQLLGAVSSRLGEPESAVSKGLGAAFPLILSALAQKANDPGLLSQIMSLLTSPANTPDVLANPRSILTGEPSSSGMTELGSNLLATLFGTQADAATNALSEYAGVKSTSASSLMTLGATLITGLLGDHVRRDGLNGAGLASLLNGQRDGILNALPGMLSGIAGLGALRDVGSRATAAVRHAPPQSGSGWLWAAAAALILALGAWALWGRGTAPHVTAPATDVAQRAGQAVSGAAQQAGRVAGDAAEVAHGAAQQAGQAVSGAAQQAGDAAGDAVRAGQLALAKLGSLTTRRLPTNIELSVPERGVETQVIAYLDDPSKQLEPVVWFNFDRLLFETGSATLQPQSQEQLKNIAEILKAYPTVKVKIGGYTDNTGDPAANLKLSQERAANVMTAIVALGIAPERVSAEGFGEQHPWPTIPRRTGGSRTAASRCA